MKAFARLLAGAVMSMILIAMVARQQPADAAVSHRVYLPRTHSHREGTPTQTPVALGENLVLKPGVVVFASANSENAQFVADGHVHTIWDAGAKPVQHVMIAFDEPSGYGVGAMDISFPELEFVEIVISQASPGRSTHDVWLLEPNGETSRLQEFDGDTADGQTLSFRVDPARQVRRFMVRTLRSPGTVAWRDIRLYAPVPPPWSPTPTPTRTATPALTATPSATGTPTPIPPTTTRTSTPTPAVTSTPTATATPTGTFTTTITPTHTPLETSTPAPEG